VIIQDGLKRMYAERQDVYYYLTVMNENYPMPAMPDGAAPGIVKGMYLFRRARRKRRPRACNCWIGHDLSRGHCRGGAAQGGLGRGGRLVELPSFTELARDGMASARANLMHPAAKPTVSHVEACLAGTQGRSLPPPITSVPSPSRSAPTCRADTSCSHRWFRTFGHPRKAAAFLRGRPPLRLRRRAEGTGRRRTLPMAKVAEAIRKYGLDPAKPAPWTV